MPTAPIQDPTTLLPSEEAAIREAFAMAWRRTSLAIEDALTNASLAVDECFLREDFRSSEADDLGAALTAVQAPFDTELDDLAKRFRSALEAAAIAFAASHPDAPRADDGA